MTTAEKVAYLKGLAEGYGTDPSTKEGKLLTTILDILEDLALDQEDLNGSLAELGESLDAISEDLEDVEDLLFGEEEEEDEEDEDGEIEDWDGETVFYECQCPNCGETITFEESVLAGGSIQCPSCGEELEFETDADAPEGE